MSFCSWSRGEKYRDHFEVGTYVCVKCEHPLFSSMAKYEHHTPWPAFSKTVRPDSLTKRVEHERQESSRATALKVLCGRCEHPLGHEFIGDGPKGASRF